MMKRSAVLVNTARSGLVDEKALIEYLNLKLRSKGYPIFGNEDDYPFLQMGSSLLQSVAEKNRLLREHLCPVDQRIQDYIERLFKGLDVEERKEVGLRLRLRLHDVPELVGLPWEYLYDPQHEYFLALSQKMPIVRYIEMGGMEEPLEVARPLRILMVIPTPPLSM